MSISGRCDGSCDSHVSLPVSLMLVGRESEILITPGLNCNSEEGHVYRVAGDSAANAYISVILLNRENRIEEEQVKEARNGAF
ncbi:hypothetical protein SAY86_014425 [Trapa natans]|uniref:Uncharacterized protein n=1 Tax=Trapa natans TaxID=22666 RepID=A0AAN7KT93_TRANT|nr:hypothetical protein SAY86_014425 [Trapa natans]